MCGIAGIVRAEQTAIHDREIRRMTRSLAHRGPDGEGIFLHHNVAIGHRRLSIIDLDGGHQPMSNEDQSIWITYNGEIYNYRELADQLASLGHRFKSRSDTETIIHAYEQWGDGFVRRLRGMFAFALVDTRRRRVLLARDRVGIKPLYYRIGRNYFAFASELATLLHVHDASPNGDCRALDLYLQFGYIPSPHTIYQDIYKLPPASSMVVDFRGDAAPPARYWQFKYQPADSIREDEWIERLDHVLTESVKNHLIADVPVGVLLSGGIDSTLIAMKAAQLSDKPITAFCIGFHDKQVCELKFARQAARRIGIELESEIVDEDALHLLPDLVRHYGEPFSDNSALATWFVSRLSRRHVPVVLSGDGGDELFGGYQTYLKWLAAASWQQAYDYFRQWPRLGLQWAIGVAQRRWVQSGHHLLHDWINCSTPRRPNLWRKEFLTHVNQPSELFIETAEKALRLGRLDFAQFMDFHTYLPCDIMTKVDIASMYHGLEARPPLLDNNMIDLATTVPPRFRIKRTAGHEPVGKYLLKKLLGRDFPPQFINRNKQGFIVPATQWFQHGRQMAALLTDMINDPDGRMNQLFRPEPVLQAIHQAKRAGLLWKLVVLGLWLEQNRHVAFDPGDQASLQTGTPYTANLAQAA